MHKKYDVSDILEKGHELIRVQGYNNTGIEDILKACGIPKGSFYNFFKSKEDFGVKAVDYYGQQQYDFAKQVLTRTKASPIHRLKQYYETLVSTNVAEECKNGCLMGNVAQEMGGLSQSLSEATDRNLKRTVKLIEACIQESQSLGEIRTDYSAADLADYLHNCFYGALLRAKSKHDDQPFSLFLEMAFNFIRK